MNVISRSFPEEDWPPIEQETLPSSSVNETDLPGLEDHLLPLPINYSWDPHPNIPLETHQIYHKLRHRLHRIEKLVQSCNDNTILYALRLFQDAHIPLAFYLREHTPEECSDENLKSIIENLEPNVDRMFHEGSLPNLLGYLPYCNYWKDKKKKKKCSFIEALLWLISKSIPWRCNVRAIRNTLTRDCLPEHPNIYEIIMSFFAASLLGSYRHAKYVPSFSCRMEIYGYLFLRPHPKEWMIQWFQWPDNQNVLQHIIREFIVFGTSLIPPLRQSMIERHKWNIVEENCYRAMDHFRQRIDAVHLSGSIHWLKNMKELLAEYDIYHLKFCEKKPNPRLVIEKIAEACIEFEDSMFGNTEYQREVFTEEERSFMKKVLQNCPLNSIPWYILKAPPPRWKEMVVLESNGTEEYEVVRTVNINENPFATEEEILRKLGEIVYKFYEDRDVKIFAPFFKTLSVYNFQKISHFFTCLKEIHSVRILTLPMHYYEAQLKAHCKKERCARPADLPEKTGWYYYSIYCGFKGLLVPVEGTKQRTDNLNAFGSHEAMFSFYDNKPYCFHKKYKVNPRKRKMDEKRSSLDMFAGLQDTNTKRKANDYRRQKIQEMCTKTPLQPICLLGSAIECPEGLITECCNCANPAVFGINKFHGGEFVCTRCTGKDKTPVQVFCYYCNRLQKKGDIFETIEVFDDVRFEQPRYSTIQLCKKCNKKWVSKGDDTFPLSYVIQGIKNNWKAYNVGGSWIPTMGEKDKTLFETLDQELKATKRKKIIHLAKKKL